MTSPHVTVPNKDVFFVDGFGATKELTSPNGSKKPILANTGGNLALEVNSKNEVIPNFLGNSVQMAEFMNPRPMFGIDVDGAHNLTMLLQNNEAKDDMNNRMTTKNGVSFYNDLFDNLGGKYNAGAANLLAGQKDYEMLEKDFRRVLSAFAAIDGANIVTESNRRMMLRYMSENVSDATLARANYEVMVSNVNDMRDTYYKTQEKIMDMGRLNEVQTYYKMYYGAKKKIILETILVVVLLVILHTLRRNGILPDGLFNVFFVIVLFVYIFFRLSWQIADFLSRDKRYFDKYEWGQLDGSYNFYKFKDPPSEVSYSEKEKVNKCLNKFFKKLSNKRPTFSQLRSLLCSYEWMLQKDIEKNQTFMHTQMLYVVIYETLYHKYISNAKVRLNKTVWDTCIKEDYDKCNIDAAKEAADTDNENDNIVTQIVLNCNDRDTKVKKALLKFTGYEDFTKEFRELPTSTQTEIIEQLTNNTSIQKLKDNLGGNTNYNKFISITKYLNTDWCVDPEGIIQIAYYFACFYSRLKEFLQHVDGTDETITYATKMYFSEYESTEPNQEIIKTALVSLSKGKSASQISLNENKLPTYKEIDFTELYYFLKNNDMSSESSASPSPTPSPTPLPTPTGEIAVFTGIYNELIDKLKAT